MSNSEKIQVQSLDHLYNSHCEGYRPKKDLIYNGTFHKNNKFGRSREFAISSKDGKSGILHNHKTAKSINWFLKDHTFKKSTYKKTKATEKKIKDVSKEFEKFAIAKSHPYTTAKKVSIASLNFRQDRVNLLIPFYTLNGHFMTGWQVIWSQTNDKGKWPKTTRKGSSNKDVYLPIGEETEKIYVAEGPSTALSVFNITGQQTYCTFGKNNLHNVTEYLLNTFTKKEIVLCLDFDKDHPYIPTLKNSRLKILQPDKKGDFNDFQFDDKEKEKLIKCRPVYEPPEPQKTLPKDVENLNKRFDNLGYELRLNTRKDRIEIKGFGSKKWEEITDEGYSLLYLQVKGGGKLTRQDFNDRLKALAHNKQVEPFKEYLESLEWDGEARLKNVLPTLFKVNNNRPKSLELAEWAFKSILLVCVIRTYEPGAKHDEFCILRGPQGIGKSSLFYWLFKDKSFFSNSVNFKDDTKKLVEVTLGKVIIEMAELVGLSQADLEKMKNVITAQQDTVRLAWRKNARDYKRKYIFVGTTNSSTALPDDPTGLRRFIVIELTKKMEFKDIKEYVKKYRDQWWAEALELYKQKKSARLPQELWPVSAEVAEDHRGGDRVFEYAFKKEINGRENINVPKILKELKTNNWIKDFKKVYQNKAIEILKREGYKMKRIRENGVQIRVWNNKALPKTEALLKSECHSQNTPKLPF